MRNILERGVILADGGVIRPEQLPRAAVAPVATDAIGAIDAAGAIDRHEADIPSLEAVERRYLVQVLARLGGDKDDLAKRLGISRRTLNRKLQVGHDVGHEVGETAES